MKNNRIFQGLRYSLFVDVHPFKGFWELKSERIGDSRVATIFLAVLCLATVLSKQYTAYLFRTTPADEVNIFKEVALVLALFFGWVVANWCLTTLFDGEGTMRDIYIATAYALVPYTVATLALIPVSYLFSQNEAALYNGILMIVMIWTALLMLCSVLVTHQYALGKTLLMIACIILCMCMFAYIFLLFFNLIQQVRGFIVNLEKEIVLRVS